MLLICQMCSAEFKTSNAKRKYCSRGCAATRDYTGINERHGHTRRSSNLSPEWVSWRDMRHRCTKPYRKEWLRYGGRGIKVCERWDSFENFIADMGPKPSREYTIERDDTNGDYTPENCRWIHKSEQSKNRNLCWTADEDRKIREGISLGYNFPQIAALVGKPASAVSSHAYKLGLSSGQPVRKIQP